VGEPFVLPGTPNKAKGELLIAYTDEIMRRIAALLPQAYRGVYALTDIPAAPPAASLPESPEATAGPIIVEQMHS
jgi:hypothetical protein